MPTSIRRPSAALPSRLTVLALVCALLAAAAPAGAATNSARYRFEGNRWLALDLAVEEIRADTIRFEWPSTVLGFKSGYKAVVKVTNGSKKQTSIGLAVGIYDEEGKFIGAGTTGTKVGTLSPGDTAEFAIGFDNVTSRLTSAAQFHIALETH
jgi:hypothetical protein